MYEGLPIASKVLAVFAVMAAGVAARRVGWLSQEADRSLMRLAVNLMLPCLFFHRIVTDPSLDRLAEVSVPPLVGFGTTVAGFALAALVAVVFRGPLRLGAPAQRRAFTLCTGLYNYAYVPLPIAIAFFPDAVTTLIVHNLGVEVAFWGVGPLILSGVAGPRWWRRVLTPPVVAISLAVLVGLGGQAHRVPQLAIDATQTMGQAGIPLGLVLSGATVYDLWGGGEWLAHWRAFAVAAALRLVALPVAFLLLARYGGLSVALQKVVVLQAAMPAATFPLVVTKLYGQDTPTAFRVVVGTTALSVVTIPLWIAVGCRYLGLTFH